MIRVLLIPSSDYLGHPFPQRHNQIFERLHNGKEFEVHVLRFGIFRTPKLQSKCVMHEIPLEFKARSTPLYYAVNCVAYTSEIMKIIKQESIDVIVAGNLLPPLLLKVCMKLTSLRIPIVFDLQDYYPTSAAGYIFNVSSGFGKMVAYVFESITRYLIKSAYAVTTPGIALARYAAKVGASRVYLIPNGISDSFLKIYEGNCIRHKLGYSQDDLVVGYVGSVEFWLDLKTLIKAVSEARCRGLPVKLLLIGGHLQTNYYKNVVNWIEKYGVTNVTTLLGFISHNEVPRYIAAMDVGTIPFDVSNPTAYYSAPNKMWEYLSQKKTVISAPIPEALNYSDCLLIASTYFDFVDKLSLIAYRNQEVIQKTNVGYNRALKRTWNKSANDFALILSSLIYK